MPPPRRARKTLGQTPPRSSAPRGANRGPAAAAENREKILAAARRLFVAHGYRVPLSTIAQEAGVGQGVLYRHFPGRLELATAAFEGNLDAIEAHAAAHPGPDGLVLVWRRMVETLLESTAFVEVVAHAADAGAAIGAADRMAGILAGRLEQAREAGIVREDLEVEDLFLLVRMVHGLAVTNPRDRSLADQVRRAVGLVDPALAWPPEP
ncbi:TetR/AcrR family transcriptional regulator [Phycicoccus sp. BSK3Z-2]|uniref:TetR/AcrR family transcriptional regulator n=1 Tax=Phycicoccus avicenniae TaxID=2828860 RepID=A0A941D5K1_9MICO|nr:TetR/AcrR family transcriptional regulator [Phycicoccus avicenniae]MBR7742036.1 TetR/AcrR family transcriptional regulator [Phycicoccus avicenniae]